MDVIVQKKAFEQDRSEVFQELAQRRARGEPVFTPAMLSNYERRLYVRSTLREDHHFRIHNRPEGAQAKFDKLTQSAFTFFRGAAMLYYRDYAGSDAELPIVFCVGDAHPENFGVMPNASGAPVFGVNDYDEAHFAPFSWDIKRGAVGFYLVARENGFKKKTRRKIVAAFVNAYLNGLREFALDDREKWTEMRLDNSPSMVRNLLESALEPRREWLEKYVDLKKSRFRPTDEIVPQSKDVTKLQEIIDRYRRDSEIDENTRAGHFQVKDVAIKKDSGTASLGLDRYFVLIDGETKDPSDDIILEIKQSRRSALYGLAPGSLESDEAAQRIVKAHDVHLCGGDPYYGQATIDGHSFLVRERSPFKEDIDVDDLSAGEMEEYANICGLTLALAHARSDADTGVMEGDAEAKILTSIQPDVFRDDVVRFAKMASKRIVKDYKFFQEDHALGAFQFSHD